VYRRMLLGLFLLALLCAACGATPEPTAAPTPLPPTSLPTATTTGQIVFDSNRGGDYRNIYVMDTNGASVVRLTTDETNDFAGPRSPDGKRIAYTW